MISELFEVYFRNFFNTNINVDRIDMKTFHNNI